jgi:flagellar motility protein MotE (MotC chaperone)
MIDGIKSLSLSGLFESLHQSMLNFAGSLGSLIEENKAVSLDDIRTLRAHIKDRLAGNEEITDKQKLLKLLDLFSTDRAVVELMKEEAQEWVEMLEGIENSITKQGVELTAQEKEEVEKIGRLTAEIKGLIRR